jgi:hypothetical protein
MDTPSFASCLYLTHLAGIWVAPGKHFKYQGAACQLSEGKFCVLVWTAFTDHRTCEAVFSIPRTCIRNELKTLTCISYFRPAFDRFVRVFDRQCILVCIIYFEKESVVALPSLSL